MSGACLIYPSATFEMAVARYRYETTKRAGPEPSISGWPVHHTVHVAGLTRVSAACKQRTTSIFVLFVLYSSSGA